MHRRPETTAPQSRRPLCALLFAAMLGFVAPPAAAQIFSGDNSRRIDALEAAMQRVESNSRAQLTLSNQLELQSAEIARLRGQVEVLVHQLETLTNRQRDFYVDLDERLRRLETGGIITDPALTGSTTPPAGDATASAADPAVESAAYEAALGQLKQGKYREAMTAFESFVRTYPASAFAPNAYFWAGNAALQAKEVAAAGNHFRAVLGRWPTHSIAPDAMLGLANSQQALGDARSARRTLEDLVARHPDSKSAGIARQRLGG